MASVDEFERLAGRYEEIQQELVGVLGSIKQMRELLERAPEELVDIRKVLSSIGKSTETAAHKLLEMIEEMLEEDEKDNNLEILAKLDVSDEGKRAIENITNSFNRRQDLLNEMLMQMSFQDLTCQTLQKASNRLVALQEELDVILSGERGAIELLDKKHAGSMSGIKRLKESQETGSQQDMIDQLLNGG